MLLNLKEEIRFYKLVLYLSGPVKDYWSCQSSQSKALKYSVISFSSGCPEASTPNLPDRDKPVKVSVKCHETRAARKAV